MTPNNESKTENSPEQTEPEQIKKEKTQKAEQPKKTAPKKKKETELEEKLETLNDTYLRMLAEYDNYRKRTQKEKESMFSDGINKVAAAILPVLDNFERALASDGDETEFRNGIDMIYRQLITTLEGLGITAMECVGQTFDPVRHNAIMHVDDESHGENEVIEVFQKGYLYKDNTVIRHAVVKVAN